MAIIGSAEIVVNAITTGFRRQIEAELQSVGTSVSNMGSRAGSDFSKSFSSGAGNTSAFDKLSGAANQANQTFKKLVRAGYTLGPALAGGISAISDLVFGLFAVGSAVGSAAPALAVIPSLLSAIGQAAITAKLAFGGIIKAVQSLTRQQSSGGSAAVKNDKAIANARKGLARAYQAAGDALASANDRVRKAQVNLNKAYKDGAEALQQLGFAAEGAVLSEEQAAIDLERARETLLRAQDMPADSRLRREAELAFKEAELNYRKAKDTSADLAVQQEYAKKTGIEGTQEVMDAKAELAAADADLARTQRDNAQSIADAQEALAEALRETSGAAGGAADAFRGLSPEAERFARYLASLKPVLDQLRAAAGRYLFGQLETAIQNLVDNLVPVLIPILEETGRAIGRFAVNFSTMLTSNLGIIERVFGDANIRILNNLGDAFVNLAQSALYILDAVAPLAVEFSAWIKTVTAGWRETLKASHASGELADKFNTAADAARIIGGVLKSTWNAIKELGKAAAPAGLALIKAFGGAMDKLKEFGEAGNKDGSLPKKFMDIAENVKSIGSFLGEVIKALFELAGNPGVKAFFDAIKPIPGIFADMGKELAGPGLGKTLGDLAVKATLLVSALTESGSIQIFFSILSSAVGVLNNIFSNPLVQRVFLFVSAIAAVSLAFGTLGKVAKFGIEVLIGKIGGLGTAMSLLNPANLGMKLDNLGVRANTAAGRMNAVKAAGGAGMTGALRSIAVGASTASAGLTALAGATLAAAAPFLIVVAVVAAVAALFYGMYKNSKALRDSISALGETLKKGFGDVMEDINKALADINPKFTDFGKVLKAMGDWVAKYVVPIIQGYLMVALKAVGIVIVAIIKVIGWLIKNWKAIAVVLGVVGVVLLALTGPIGLIIIGVIALAVAIKNNWDKIKDAISAVVNTITGILKTIWDFILPPLKIVWGLVEAYFKIIIGFWTGVITTFYNIGKGIWDFFFPALKYVWNLIVAYWTFIFNFWKAVVTNFIIIGKIIWDFLFDKVKESWGKVTDYWNKTVMPFITDVKVKFDTKLAKIWAYLTDGIKESWGKVTDYWNKTVMPFITDVKVKFDTKLAKIWAYLTDGIKESWGKVTDYWDKTIMPFIAGLKGKFDTKLGNLWGGFTSKLKDAAGVVRDTLNRLIGFFNRPINWFNARRGPLAELPTIPTLPEFAKGGVVYPRTGGVVATVAEAGRPERIEPLDSQGLSVRDRAIIAQLSGGGGDNAGGNTFVINPSPGMDEIELSHMVSRRVVWAQKRGA
jgi:phage-related protein